MTKEVNIDIYNMLKDRAEKIGNILKNSMTNLLIVKPNADNLCSAGILLSMFLERNKSCHLIYSEKNLEKNEEFHYENYWYIGYEIEDIPHRELIANEKKIIVINHELKEVNTENEKKLTLLTLKKTGLSQNVISNAGLTYFITKSFDENYSHFATLALMGALDKEQINSKTQELIGINKFFLNEAIEKNIIKVSKGTKIKGRDTKPIHLALKYSIDPYFPGLTGNEQACTSFLSRLGIKLRDAENKWRTINDLTVEEIRSLNDGLITLLMTRDKDAVKETYKLIGPLYYLKENQEKKEIKNIEEYLQLISGAYELQLYGLAIAVLMGNRTYQYNHLLSEIDEYYGESAKAIDIIETNPDIVTNYSYFRLIEGTKLVDKKPQHIFKTLCKSQLFELNKAIVFHFIKKEEGKEELFVYESPVQKKKGYPIYPIFQEIEDMELIKDLSEEKKFFEMKIEKNKLMEIITILNEKLDYHYTGENEEDKEQTQIEKKQKTKKEEKSENSLAKKDVNNKNNKITLSSFVEEGQKE